MGARTTQTNEILSLIIIVIPVPNIKVQYNVEMNTLKTYEKVR